MIKSFFLILLFSLNAQALQILQPKNDYKIVKQQLGQSSTTQSLSSEQLLTQLEKSAKSGNARAQFSLANIHQKGINVKADPRLAFYWYSQVAKQGYPNAQFIVAKDYHQGINANKDLEVALQWYEKSAEQDFVDAQYQLATMYALGDEVAIDNTRAYEWYERAAQLGHEQSQLIVAKRYDFGIDVAKNPILAKIGMKKQLNKAVRKRNII